MSSCFQLPAHGLVIKNNNLSFTSEKQTGEPMASPLTGQYTGHGLWQVDGNKDLRGPLTMAQASPRQET